MRDKVKHDMGSIVQGWGVWLETVEVTEVTVCSKSLFDDMQVEFRQQSRQAAELTKLSAKEKIEQATVASNLQVRLEQFSPRLGIGINCVTHQEQHLIMFSPQISKMKTEADHSTALYKASKKMEESIAAAEHARQLTMAKVSSHRVYPGSRLHASSRMYMLGRIQLCTFCCRLITKRKLRFINSRSAWRRRRLRRRIFALCNR